MRLEEHRNQLRRFSPLQPWLDRKDPLHSFVSIDTRRPNQEYGGFLAFDVSVPIHEIADLQAESLETSWARTNDYVRESLELIDADQPLWLDREEVEMIRNTLGQPPPACYPIYLVTVGTSDSERAVYVGKTSAKTARFRLGHKVATDLHAPKYNGLAKQLYQGCVVLLADDKEYLPLEWVHPLSSAMDILSSVEAQLVFELQPELNIQHKKQCNAAFPIHLHIQNFSGTSKYLDNALLHPR